MKDNILVAFGGNMKSLGETETGYKVCGWAVVFDTVDLAGDKFTAKTDFDLIDGERRGLYYAHGFDPAVKRAKIGDVTLHLKDAGLWFEGEIKKRSDYLAEYVDRMHEGVVKGLFGTSSGAPAHMVERDGESITKWIFSELSITPTPCEPRTAIMPLRSLIPDATDEETKELTTLTDGQLEGSRFHEHSSRLHGAVEEYKTRVQKYFAKDGFQEGRNLGEAALEHLELAHKSLREASEELGGYLDKHRPVDPALKAALLQEAMRAEMARFTRLTAEI